MNVQERIDLITKIQKQNSFVKNILDKNESLQFIETKELSRLLKTSNALLNKLEKNNFEIAIVGLEKAGKSTFANALIESNILPSAPERCTFTSTKLLNGEDKAIVTFYTKDEFNQKLRELLSSVEYPLQSSEEDLINRLSIDEFEHYFNELENKNPTLYKLHIGKTNEEIKLILKYKQDLVSYLTGDKKKFSAQEVLSNDFKYYITGEKTESGLNASKPYSVKSIEIYSSKLKQLENAIIYDVPGFDSPTQSHSEQTSTRLKSADAIILVTNVGKNPNIQGTSLNILREEVDEDGLPLKDKLFIFGNQKDIANSYEQAEENENTLKKDMEIHKIAIPERVFTGSALKYLSQHGIASDVYTEKFEINDGIMAIRDNLIHYYQTERFYLIKQKLDKNTNDIIKSLAYLYEKYSQIKLPQDPEYIRFDLLTTSQNEIHNLFLNKIKDIRASQKERLINTFNLTERLQTRFEEISKNKNPKITSETLNELKRKLDNSSSNDFSSERINLSQREKILSEIKQNSAELIRGFFEEEGENIEANIIQNLCDATTETPSIQIKEIIKKYIIETQKENIYDSEKYEYLFDRFARNVFDMFNYNLGSPARIQKFNNAKKDFIYLDSYYCENKEFDFDLITLLLTQKSDDKNLIKEIFKIISETVKDWIDDKFHIELANKGFETLRKVGASFFRRNQSIGDENHKQKLNSSSKDKLFDLVDAGYIAKHVKSNQEIDDIVKEINLDIDLIQDIIKNAVIKAMNVEAVFFNSIDKQLSLLESETKSEKFRIILREITYIKKHNELNNIEKIIEINNQKSALLMDISNYLSQSK